MDVGGEYLLAVTVDPVKTWFPFPIYRTENRFCLSCIIAYLGPSPSSKIKVIYSEVTVELGDGDGKHTFKVIFCTG